MAAATAMAIASSVSVPPAVALDAYCTYSETPPTPPEKGAVLWSPPASPGSTDPNTIVFPQNSQWYDLISGCNAAVAANPRVIAVAPGAALQWGGGVSNVALISPWGAVNVSLSDPAPVIVPPEWQSQWGSTTVVEACDPVSNLAITGSCRNCDFSGNPNVGFVSSSEIDPDFKIIQFASDVSGSNFTDSGIGGDASGYDFSGATLDGAAQSTAGAKWLMQGAKFDAHTTAIGTHFDGVFLNGVTFPAGMDLSGATFSQAILDGAVLDHAVVTNTSFDGAWLRSARMVSLQFTVPPSFRNTLLGEDDQGGPCTAFVDSNLAGSAFDGVNWQLGCSGPPFQGSQLSVDALKQFLATPQLSALPIDWTGAQIVVSPADRAALAGSNLTGANIAKLTFLGESLDLTGTTLNNANLSGTDFTLARLAGASLQNVTAPGAVFESADLSGDGTHAAASLAGSNTHLEGASFVNADISGASFIGAHLDNALFGGARGVSTDFSGVSAPGANFARAHLYGKGDAFDNATDLRNVDFSEAVLAGNVSESGGFDLTGAALLGARFDGTVCVNCNFTNGILTPSSPGSPSASFIGAYLPGVQLAGAELAGVDFEGAWLYCGDANNTACQAAGAQRWSWPLTLGSGEVYGPVPFGVTDVANVSLADVSACPSGKSGATAPAGCTGNLLPTPAVAPPLPAPCSASGRGACPSLTATVFDATKLGKPLAIAAAAPPTWNTALPEDNYLVAMDDHTLRQFGDSSAVILAGQAGTTCGSATAACGDGGPATAALLGTPNGLAVGLDGSVYLADAALLRVRRIDPTGTIRTVAGTGIPCAAPPCGDGGQATAASLTAANGVAVDTHGVLLIADGAAGVRRVGVDGTLTTLAPGTATGTVVSVVQAADGQIFAATSQPDGLIQIDPTRSPVQVTPVVGTGTSGYNGNSQFGILLPGTAVQVNEPRGLAVNLDGNVLFADSGNHLIRAYVPATGHVIDDLAGVITNGTPQGGFNGDKSYANATELNGPLGVAATRSSMLVIADTGNQRVRVVGPAPLDALSEMPRPVSVIECRPGRVLHCRRRVVKLPAKATLKGVPVTLRNHGAVFATGRKLAWEPDRLRFRVTEQRPLVPGWYKLTKRLGSGLRHFVLHLR